MHLSILLIVVSLIAMGISGYLAQIAFTSSRIAGCGGGTMFDCNDVVNSRWSRWMGIPVSALAFGLYTTIFLSLIVAARTGFAPLAKRVAWGLVTVLGVSAGLAAIWFIYLQIFVIKHLCTYCLAAHACGVIVAFALIWKRPAGTATKYLSVLSLLGIAALIGGQFLVKPKTYQIIEFDTPAVVSDENADETNNVFEFLPPPVEDVNEEVIEADVQDNSDSAVDPDPNLPGEGNASIFFLHPSLLFHAQVTATQQSQETKHTDDRPTESKPERRFVSLSGGTIKLDVAQWPLAGKQDAKYIFVEMFDYTCDHCRRTHAAVAGAKQKLGDDLAVVMLAIPLNTKCNSAITVTGPRMAEACEIAQLAIAVWRAEPTKFSEFHEYLMTTPDVVTYAEARAKADGLVDRDKLAAELAKPVAGQYIAQHVELYKRVGSGNVPKMLFPGTTIVGEFTSPDSLVEIIKRQLD